MQNKKIIIYIIFLVILLMRGCVKYISKEKSISESPEYYDNLYEKAETKKQKIEILETLQKVKNPEVSIVLIRAFFDSEKEVVKKAYETLDFFRISVMPDTKRYFFYHLSKWWAKYPRIILRQMNYQKEFTNFIDELKEKGYETHVFEDNPLYFLIEDSIFKTQIAELISYFKLNKDFSKLQETYDKSKYLDDTWEKIQKYLVKKKQKYTISKIRFFWSFF